jgi:hypothetical protein
VPLDFFLAQRFVLPIQKYTQNDFLPLADKTWTKVIGDSLQDSKDTAADFPAHKACQA